MADRRVNIQVFKTNLTKVTEIDEFESLVFTRSFYGYGTFEIKIDAGNTKAFELTENRFIMLSNYTNKIGIIKHIEATTQGNGTIISVRGYEVKGILSQRYTIPPTAQDQQSFTDTDVETVIKSIVQRNCIDLTDYAFSNFAIATNQNRGNTIDFNTRYKKLSDEVKGVGQSNDIGHTMYFDFTTGNVVFDVVEGVNRVQSQSVNNRAIFAIKFDNVKMEKYIKSSLNCFDSAIIAGQGEGATREIETINNNSGYAMQVMFVDARDITGTDNLLARGNERLATVQQLETFDNMIYHDRTMVYETDWDLGDYVTLQSDIFDVTVDKQILEVTEFYTMQEGFELSVSFGERLQTINDVINEKTAKGVE